MESEIKVIDYLIENGSCDLCGKCEFYVEPNKNEDFTPCQMFEKHGNTACRNGMIEYFKNNE